MSHPRRVVCKRLHPAAHLPDTAHPGDAGFDLHASEELLLAPGERGLVKTGLALEIPPGMEGQVRPRSGLALKYGVTVLNTPGTIDAGYRGEVGVILINLGSLPFKVEVGMRIAQLVFATLTPVTMTESDTLSESHRGDGGFGSTGLLTQE